MGGKDLVKRKWKNLAEVVTLECDGKDLTPKLKEHKVHAVVFLNIPRLVKLILFIIYLPTLFCPLRYKPLSFAFAIAKATAAMSACLPSYSLSRGFMANG